MKRFTFILALGLGIAILAGVEKARAQVSPQDVVLIEATPNTGVRLTNLAEFSGYKEPGTVVLVQVPWLLLWPPSYPETDFRDSLVGLLGQWLGKPWNFRDPGWKGPDSSSSCGFVNEALLRANSSLYRPPGNQIVWPGWSMPPQSLLGSTSNLTPGRRLKKGDMFFRITKGFSFRPGDENSNTKDHLAVVYSAPDTGLILADTSSSAFPDVDGDGVPDPFDNCVGRANPGQEDSSWLDGNFIGDACEGPPACVAEKGDMNGDSNPTPADVVLMLNCIFLGSGSCDFCFSDLNCDSSLTPADAVLELNFVFLANPLPC